MLYFYRWILEVKESSMKRSFLTGRNYQVAVENIGSKLKEDMAGKQNGYNKKVTCRYAREIHKPGN